MSSSSSLRPTLKRTISSRSFKKQGSFYGTTDINLDDNFSVGDDDLLIEYRKVPWRLWMYGIFHSLIEFQFFPLLAIIMTIILLIILLFAEIYLSISPQCGLDLYTLGDAWLFSVLVHFRSVFAPANPNNLFWNGCTEGILSIFAQLFIGNILMSILLSCLLFNFQSIARRSKSLFTTITMGQRLFANVDKNGNAFLSFPVVELNESKNRKVTQVTVQVFMFDPFNDSGSSIKTLASNIPLGTIEVPQEVTVPLDSVSLETCNVCGKSFDDKSALIKHFEYFISPANPHIESYRRFKIEQNNLGMRKLQNTQMDVLNRLWNQDLEFIIIVEGSDPVTTDRVQVQKIFKSRSILPAPRGITYISSTGDIDYKHFL